jgi:two-component system, NarL family, sensor histidine kinase UhpB
MAVRWLGVRGRRGSLAHQVFLANAAVLVASVLVLVLTPLTVSFPVLLTEAVIIAALLAATLVADLWLVRRAFEPLARFTNEVRAIDPRQPPRELEMDAQGEVGDLVEAFDRMLERIDDDRRERGRHAVAAQEAERERIARELHDQIGQQLTAVLLHLRRLHDEAPPSLREAVEGAQESARASLDDVRRVAQRLRPDALDDLGLVQAIAGLCSAMEGGNAFRIERRLDADLPPLEHPVELAIYRVAQESLTNAARHSGATRVTVGLTARCRTVELVVADDGRGSAGSEPGSGVLGMRERAGLIGADLRIEPTAGGGTTVRLSVPLPVRT